MSKSRTFDSQYRTIYSATKGIAHLVTEGYRIVITHGNESQVGDDLLRHDSAKKLVPPLPLFACVAETQGLLGFMIQTSLLNHLNKFGKRIGIVSLISKTIVSKQDPAFKDPVKPVGPVFTKNDLKMMMKENAFLAVKEVAPNHYRRVVPSPDPVSIIEIDAVRDLVNQGYVVVTVGGGGIPVLADKKLRFANAVIDKDLASERLATGINASKFVSLTNVDGVYLRYGTKSKKLRRKIKMIEMRKLLERSEFEEGSMGPKVKAAVRFVENTGHEAIIVNLNKLRDAVMGNSGTIIY